MARAKTLEQSDRVDELLKLRLIVNHSKLDHNVARNLMVNRFIATYPPGVVPTNQEVLEYIHNSYEDYLHWQKHQPKPSKKEEDPGINMTCPDLLAAAYNIIFEVPGGGNNADSVNNLAKLVGFEHNLYMDTPLSSALTSARTSVKSFQKWTRMELGKASTVRCAWTRLAKEMLWAVENYRQPSYPAPPVVPGDANLPPPPPAPGSPLTNMEKAHNLVLLVEVISHVFQVDVVIGAAEASPGDLTPIPEVMPVIRPFIHSAATMRSLTPMLARIAARAPPPPLYNP